MVLFCYLYGFLAGYGGWWDLGQQLVQQTEPLYNYFLILGFFIHFPNLFACFRFGVGLTLSDDLPLLYALWPHIYFAQYKCNDHHLLFDCPKN